MQFQIEEIGDQLKELETLNAKLKNRADKFNSVYTPLTVEDLRLLKLKKAKETGDEKYLSTLYFEEVTDLQTRNKLIKDRTEKFYNTIKVEDATKYFEEKIVPDFSDENIIPRENALHFYGVDYMSNEMIKAYIQGQRFKFKIEWINDSSCNIVLEDKTAAEALLTELRRDESNTMKQESEEIWYELKPYVVQEKERRLFCRIATNKDVKSRDVSGKNSKYYQYIMSKLKLKNAVQYKAKQKIYKTHRINKELHYKNKVKVQKKEQASEESSSSAQSSSSDDQKEK